MGSLAVRQKELSEKHRITLKRQKCIENEQNLCNFPFFLISFSLFSIFLHFFPFFFFLLFSLQVYDRDGLYDKMGLQLKALKARLLRRWFRHTTRNPPQAASPRPVTRQWRRNCR